LHAVIIACILRASAAAAPAGDTENVVVPGFFRGTTVRYLDFGPIELARGNTVAPIWVVTNGTARQRNIIDVVPGQDGYTPLWRVTMVTWKPGVMPRTLKSAAAVRAALAAGEASLRRTSTVVNCPVLGFGQQRVRGFVKGDDVEYLDLGPVKLRPGNDVEPIWVVTNGTEEQRNVIDTVPGDPDYTPLWAVRMVTWKGGVTPRTLRSASEVESARDAGEVTIEMTDVVVNCPVV
jgi:hypothetical protein